MTTAEEARKFAEDGFLVVEDFVSKQEVAAMREECRHIVEEMKPAEHNTIFSTTKQSYRDDYFLNSGDKIRFFFEEGSKDETGNLKVDKHIAVNKIGHALHAFCPSFKRATFSDKVKAICRNMNYEDPVVCQSMYIFKQPKIGGVVVPHQDATYLWADTDRVMGFWIALQDTTVENGCLWFIAGSHKDGLYGDYRMIRSPKHDGDPSCVYTGTKPEYDDSRFKPVPIKKGSLIIIDGLVVHKSEHNHSNASRHIYTFHVFDSKVGQWSNQNWLQPTEVLPFPELYKTSV